MFKMAPPIALFVFFLLAHSVLPKRPPFLCENNNGIINSQCGELKVKCSENNQKIQLKRGGHWFRIEDIPSQSQPHSITSIVIKDEVAPPELFDPCKLIDKYSLPTPTDSSHFSSYNYTADNTSTLHKCSHKNHHEFPSKYFTPIICREDDFYCKPPNTMSFPFEQQCQNITLPFSFPAPTHHDPLTPLSISFTLHISPACFGCDMGPGKCPNTPQNPFQLPPPTPEGQKKKTPTLGLGLGLLGLGFSFGVLFTIIGLAIIIWRRKQKCAASRNMADPEGTSSGYLGVLVFSYKDLTEATDNFNAEKILGHGSSGTVYHGKLKDGREVAVKRLSEHNYKIVQEQFLNEIEILTRLRHKNLVSLYGCTSRHCQELLLVYEYIPNGTVADHLHGDRAKTSPLTWPIRLSIAIETARALAYVHASHIVHCHVKTNNILLDNNFHVKVTDFRLSQLLPNLTQVSATPPGTPANVDPENLQCYQLTTKSDVYSFGVVLVELLSSMPAVCTTRYGHVISLSILAISKIKKRAYNELIDQGLGFASDTKVKMTTIAVAELAFECLQRDKEMRPTMDEVLERLTRIEDGKIE
ncbi:LEAF RUST 10 DISEASE-RESISTANCE LOCUS RECEPTOR-LIKE PROTEIN KINASE-like 1.1 [Humulus lupulus]|uniref:LEAF RUST 10 DISEASE-RESISTANCE LOCUS RECEPTOR-LIKE PROTEIN KINASE-like 1.1 n=1 Tax=Humulus lupulus TaxID=3486 RepID=UPI002B4051A0|nr:LEAF RUST 10 DISEASE-RESISTANCE LOCUS RECEPTOR-LIKE PROTEIN KINASE-like 1.1 [Humulus lupulus]